MHMTDARDQRLRTIADLIRTEPLANQEEVADRLASLGFAVTQATVSRDLEQLGAVKRRRNGRLAYTLPDGVDPSPELELRNVFRDWVRSIGSAGNLVVIKTPPGSAHLVGVALDQADIADVAGTICGDDTIFVAVASPKRAKALADEFLLLR